MAEKLAPPSNLKTIIDTLQELLDQGFTMEDFKRAFNWIDWKRTSVQKNWFNIDTGSIDEI